MMGIKLIVSIQWTAVFNDIDFTKIHGWGNPFNFQYVDLAILLLHTSGVGCTKGE